MKKSIKEMMIAVVKVIGIAVFIGSLPNIPKADDLSVVGLLKAFVIETAAHEAGHLAHGSRDHEGATFNAQNTSVWVDQFNEDPTGFYSGGFQAASLYSIYSRQTKNYEGVIVGALDPLVYLIRSKYLYKKTAASGDTLEDVDNIKNMAGASYTEQGIIYGIIAATNIIAYKTDADVWAEIVSDKDRMGFKVTVNF